MGLDGHWEVTGKETGEGKENGRKPGFFMVEPQVLSREIADCKVTGVRIK